MTDSGCNTSRCHHQIASHGTVYDMAIDTAAEVVVTVGQVDRCYIYIFCILYLKTNGTSDCSPMLMICKHTRCKEPTTWFESSSTQVDDDTHLIFKCILYIFCASCMIMKKDSYDP